MSNRGKIIIRGQHASIIMYRACDTRELRTIYALLSYATTDIEVLEVENIKGIKTPDILMNGKKWEIKNPKGKGKYVISRNIYNASKQSPNIVLDLRRMPGSYKHYLSEIERELHNNPRAKIIIVITKANTYLEIIK